MRMNKTLVEMASTLVVGIDENRDYRDQTTERASATQADA